jgi:hypothetical protein
MRYENVIFDQNLTLVCVTIYEVTQKLIVNTFNSKNIENK